MKMLKVTLLVLFTIVTFDVTYASAFDRRDRERRRHERWERHHRRDIILTEGMITTPAGEITDTTIMAEDINNKTKKLASRWVSLFLSQFKSALKPTEWLYQ